MMIKKRIIFLFIFLYLIHSSISTTEKHLVDDLFNGLYTKKIYSGYLSTDVEGSELFYIFTPSESSPENDPIILKLNGGPGCSTMTAFLETIGPVIFHPYKKDPVLNEYSWNKRANILYIDNPAGVGFSIIKDPNFFFNDTIQAISLNIAIQNFFKVFPEYQKNTFLINGGSYAGTYIPHLVREMFRYMDETPDAINLNLKGFLISNPYMNEETDFEDSIFDFSFTHALISPETYEKYLNECPHLPQIEKIYRLYEEKEGYKYDPIINKDLNYPWKNVTKACNEARNEIFKSLDGINIYGVYNECPSGDIIFELKNGFTNIDYDVSELYSEENILRKIIRKSINDKYKRYTGRKLLVDENPENETEYANDLDFSCPRTTYVPNFLNDNTTKAKLGVDLKIIYTRCSDPNYKWGDSMNFYKKDLKELYKKKNFTAWLISGTEDMACATIGTLRSLHELNYTIKEKWKKWKVDDQVAGMEQTYDYDLKFMTMKNTGHSVFQDQPKNGYVIFENFLLANGITNKVIPNKRHKVNDLFNGLYAKDIYSGYLTTDVEGTELFYIFTPSQSSPENDPIILWLNGGPGTSSIYGFLETIGPVIFHPYKKDPVLNEYSWNKKANIFYIESPGGVGFSTVKDTKFFYNDSIQATSLNIAIQNFFKVFPEYQKNTFLITGLSYAGTYIPHLVREMFRYMDETPDAIKLNLKGFLISNPYMNEETDWEDSIFDFSFTHALISPETYEKYLNECPHLPQIEKIYRLYEEKEGYKYDPIINKDLNYPWKNVTKACNEARNEIFKALDGINVYGILKECPSDDTIFQLKQEFTNIDYDENEFHSEESTLRKIITKNINEKYKRYSGRKLLENPEDDTEYAINFSPTCKNTRYTPNFLNDNTTKTKLGVDLTVKHIKTNANLNYKWGDSMSFYKKDLKELYDKKNFTSWIFSGTEDIACVTLGTLRTLHELNYTIKEKWKKWKVDDQVAGMEQTYDYGLKFITVKNAGHIVHEDNPKVAKIILDNYIKFIEEGYKPEPKPEPEPEPEPEPTQKPEKHEEDSFPVWAIILISVASLLIIVGIIIIIFIKTKRKNSIEDNEEEGKLMAEMTEKEN